MSVRSDRLPPDESTQGLLDRLRQGDRQALDVLLARLGPRLKRWAAGRLPLYAREGADTEDLVQDTLVHALPRLPTFEPTGTGALHAYLRDTDTGEERVMAQSLILFLPPLSWSPDGAHVLLRGTEATGRLALHHVDVGTGALSSPLSSHRSPPGARWTADGRQLLFLDARGVVAVDRATGREHVRLPRTESGLDHILRFAVSPDGTTVAYSGPLPDSDLTSLRVADLSGAVVELATSAPGERLVAQCWSPDGQQVLFTRWRQGPNPAPHALWIARRDGREARSLDFSIEGWTQANGVSMHPDGSAIAYTVGDVSWDVSRLVNFLTPDQRSTRF